MSLPSRCTSDTCWHLFSHHDSQSEPIIIRTYTSCFATKLMTYWQLFRLAGSTSIETILACVQLHIQKLLVCTRHMTTRKTKLATCMYSSRFAHQGTIIISPAFAPFYNYIMYWYMSHSKLTLTKKPNLVCPTNFPDQVGCVAKVNQPSQSCMYVHIEDCEGWWLSSVAQWQSTGSSSQRVLGLTPSDCRPFHFPLFLPHTT